MLEKQKDKMTYAIAVIIGVITFIFLYGFRVLNPCYTDWLLGKGDLSQHYLGWEFYRRSQWFFPFGLTDQLAYPETTSVIFTDSIPLFAVPFKLLKGILPESFQYFGWWGIICFGLQGYLSAKILRTLGVNRVISAISSLFFVIVPIVLYRMYRHTSLGGQWIVLLSIYFYVKHNMQYYQVKKTNVQWGCMGALIAFVHLYYLPMCGIFAGMYVIRSFVKEKNFRIKYITPLVSFMLGLLLSTYLLGGFSSNARTGSSGLGEFSFNLNGFYNPLGYSKILSNLGLYHVCQAEGMAYLGLGILILFVLSAVAIGIKVNKKIVKKIISHIDYILIILVLIIFAASPVITYGEHVLYSIPCSDKIRSYWEVFRSSGREIWSVCYLLMIFAIVGVSRHLQRIKWLPEFIVILCLGIQMYDLSGVLLSTHNSYKNKQKHELTLNSEFWKEIAESDYKHVFYAQEGIDISSIFHLAEFALENDMTMNDFYFARIIDRDKQTQEVLNKPDNQSVYIVLGEQKEEMSEYSNLFWYEEDGFTVGVTEALKAE